VRSRLRLGIGVAVLLCSVACGAAAQSSGAPIVKDCANPQLPAELLDGPVPAVASALPVVTASAPGVKLRLAVANDESTRELGLMCVTRLRPRHGMIFVFEQNREWEFWMKNTLVPLDMLWVDDDGTITTVAARVPASTRETPDDAVARRRGRGRFVIELASGEAAVDKLAVGTRLLLPALRAESH
jgi:uncharacterized membrane protein (UPF0127 family)